MMLKRKIEMTLPQLIEYIWQNDVRDRKFRSSKSSIGGSVFVRGTGSVGIKMGVVKTDMFIVEVEEEITEHTEIPNMLVFDVDGRVRVVKNSRVSYYSPHERKALYMINDDMTMTLIWTNRKGLLK